MVRLEKINKSYNGFNAVKDVSFEVNEGETLVLLGSSGSGKTTLLKIINRLIEPTSGTISINGRNISAADPHELRRSIGYVIQGIGLFPHMTILENVSIVPRLTGQSGDERRKAAEEVLGLVGLDPEQFAARYPDELSGGQQQRVGVARALASRPTLMLMDEPFGALDAVTRGLLQEELLRLKERIGKTIIFVTHDIFEAFRLADRIAVMHDGTLHQIGTPKEIASTPATDFVRELIENTRRQLGVLEGLE